MAARSPQRSAGRRSKRCSRDEHARIVCLVGPTASGKTELAVELAERFDGEIVSADSRQVYRHLDIGTAKPTQAERARVPHHGLDLVEPDTVFDAARFRTAAAEAIADIARRGRIPFVVGGTGLYLRVLLNGLCPAPPRAPALRASLAAERPEALHRRLAALDPVSAARLAPRDTVRVVRALEVVLTSGVPLSAWQARHRFAERPYESLEIGLARPRAEREARITARAHAMVDAGFLDEVRALRTRGIPLSAPGFAAVGYREMGACLDGQLDVAGALAATIVATRRLAKRQRTWFRGQSGLRWRHPEDDRAFIVTEVEDFLAGAPRVQVTGHAS
jgi:tRNA dimethylallyltransferase